MIEARADRPRAVTLGTDKGNDAQDFVNELNSMHVRPHIAQNTDGRRSAIDRRTTRHASDPIVHVHFRAPKHKDDLQLIATRRLPWPHCRQRYSIYPIFSGFPHPSILVTRQS